MTAVAKLRCQELGLQRASCKISNGRVGLTRPRVLLGQEVALAKIGSHASGPFCSTLHGRAGSGQSVHPFLNLLISCLRGRPAGPTQFDCHRILW